MPQTPQSTQEDKGAVEVAATAAVVGPEEDRVGAGVAEALA